jgi:rhodanese-related sulfurtransferase
MKNLIVQFGAIVVVSLVCGGVYNVARCAFGSDSYVPFGVADGQYADAKICDKPGEKADAPIARTREPKSSSETDKSPKTPDTKTPKTPGGGEPPIPKPEEVVKKPEFPLIDTKQAFEEWEYGTLFIDARSADEYAKGHIQGALCIPAFGSALRQEMVPNVAESEPHEEPVILYCTKSEDCPASKEIARDLKTLGFGNLLIYKGGFSTWEAEKKPFTLGKQTGERPQ